MDGSRFFVLPSTFWAVFVDGFLFRHAGLLISSFRRPDIPFLGGDTEDSSVSSVSRAEIAAFGLKLAVDTDEAAPSSVSRAS